MTPLAVAPGVEVVADGARGVIALSLGGPVLFAGEEYVAVLDAVDGTRDETAVVEVTGATQAVADLRQAGVLVEREVAAAPREAAWWRAAGTAAPRHARVSLAVVGDVDDAPARAALARAGVEEHPEADLRVVLTDDYLRDELAEHNERALDDDRPWLLAMPAAVEAWIGPVVVPDRGPCWECLAQRLRRHRRVERYLHQATGRPLGTPRGEGALASTMDAVAGMLATSVLRWHALGMQGALHDRLLSVDTRSWASASHAVVRRPQCPACGFGDPPDTPAAVAPVLTARGAARDVGGAIRTVDPRTTTERYEHHVSPISGAVQRLVRVRSARPPLHAYLAGDPGPRRYGADNRWSPGASTPPGGKGATDEQARVSALCEALERWSGVFGGEEARRAATLEELGDAAIHPNAVMGFSDAQYAARERTNAEARSMREHVPPPFDAAAQVAWTPLWSLTGRRERWLPTAFCFYEAHLPGHHAVVADSNGNAAGNTVDEAIAQGLLELVERDHVALWWYNRLRMPGLDLASFGDPWLDAVRERFAEEGRDLWALDLTADLGIPAVTALATGSRRDTGVALGFGAHPDLGRALQRAVTELVQLEAGVPSGGLGEGAETPSPDGANAYLLPDPEVPLRTPADAPPGATGDVRTDLDALVAAVEAQGLEVLVLDQTRPDIGLPVVKVVVPGMRHFWRRFAPGRLYDVPVALGHRDAPLDEADVNPIAPSG